jgi:hypothetical protein
VIDYLQQTSFGSLEEDAIHMEDSFIVKEDTGKTIASCKSGECSLPVETSSGCLIPKASKNLTFNDT